MSKATDNKRENKSKQSKVHRTLKSNRTSKISKKKSANKRHFSKTVKKKSINILFKTSNSGSIVDLQGIDLSQLLFDVAYQSHLSIAVNF